MTSKLPVDWYRPRGYLHFDRPIGRDKAESIVSDPAEVARHAFYPLISYTIVSEKARRDRDTGAIRRIPKERPIRYAAHLDAHIFSYYSERMSLQYEHALRDAGLHESVLAFRRLGDSNIEFADRAFSAIRKLGKCTAMAFDVVGFFDNIDHAVLKRLWARVIGVSRLPADHHALFKALTRYSWVSRDALYSAFDISRNNPKHDRNRICRGPDFRERVRGAGLVSTNGNACGIPQGTPISALLSNICMLEFDSIMHAVIKAKGGEYLRYCDDILVIVPDHGDTALKALVQKHIGDLNLEVHATKTETSHFFTAKRGLTCDRPLQYLGFLFDGERILIRSSALAKFSSRLNSGVRLAKATAKSRNATRARHGLPQKSLYKRKLYERYSHLGHRNFIRYGFNAARILSSPAIKRQLKPLWNRLQAAIDKP